MGIPISKRMLLLSSFLVSAIFTVLDTLVHYFYEPLEVYYYPFHFFGVQSPLANYAMSKLVSTTILLFIFFYIFSKTKFSKYIQYGLITLIVVILLELRYIIGGYYTPVWHILNFINHYLALLAAICLVGRIRIKN